MSPHEPGYGLWFAGDNAARISSTNPTSDCPYDATIVALTDRDMGRYGDPKEQAPDRSNHVSYFAKLAASVLIVWSLPRSKNCRIASDSGSTP